MTNKSSAIYILCGRLGLYLVDDIQVLVDNQS